MTTERIVYCDLDGVLCDFDKQVIKYAKIRYGEPLDSGLLTQKYGKKELYQLIGSIGEEFFSTMPPMKDMYDLKAFLFDNFINVKILSSASGPPPNTPRKMGKIKWLKTHGFNMPDQDIIITPTSDGKTKYAKPTDILIDDRVKILSPWINAGGIGILHKSAKDTIKQLRQYV